MKIQNTKDTASSTIKALIYGASGSGKTYLASTINRKTLIISAESGLLSLKGKDISVIDLTLDDEGNLLPREKRINRLNEVYNWLLTEEAMKQFECIYLDSLTEINLNLLEGLAVIFPDRKDSLVMYGELSKKMRTIITKFRDLPHYSVVFTALEETEKDDNGFRFQTVQLVGSFAARIPGYFDEVFYLFVDKDSNRSLITNKNDRVIAKDRSGKLLKQEPADLGIIFDKILGKPETKQKGEK